QFCDCCALEAQSRQKPARTQKAWRQTTRRTETRRAAFSNPSPHVAWGGHPDAGALSVASRIDPARVQRRLHDGFLPESGTRRQPIVRRKRPLRLEILSTRRGARPAPVGLARNQTNQRLPHFYFWRVRGLWRSEAGVRPAP